MTKKDYEAIAEVLRGTIRVSDEIAGPWMVSGVDMFERNAFLRGYNSSLESISQGLIKVFEKDNPRFDSERFLKACGL